MAQKPVAQQNDSSTRSVLAWILIAIGAIMIIVGFVAWIMVGAQLKSQNMTVPGDADSNAGKVVAGPFTAWSMQEIIQVHADHATEGASYAELGDKVNEAKEQYGEDSEEAAELQAMRNTQMNASFLRASLLTSVIASGVSLLAIGTGAVSVLAGAAFLARRPQVVVNADVTADAEIA